MNPNVVKYKCSQEHFYDKNKGSEGMKMKLTFKNYFFYYSVVDENDKNICKICKRNLFSIKRVICDSKVVITTDVKNVPITEEMSGFHENRTYTACCNKGSSQTIATAVLRYKSSDKKVTYLNRLPHPDGLSIKSIYGDFSVTDMGKGIYSIYNKLEPVGSLKCFFHKAMFQSNDYIQEPIFIAVLFIFIKYMDQESEFFIV